MCCNQSLFFGLRIIVNETYINQEKTTSRVLCVYGFMLYIVEKGIFIHTFQVFRIKKELAFLPNEICEIKLKLWIRILR